MNNFLLFLTFCFTCANIWVSHGKTDGELKDKYFVSFIHSFSDGKRNFGNTVIEMDDVVDTVEEIRKVENYIQSVWPDSTRPANIVVLSIVRMPVE